MYGAVSEAIGLTFLEAGKTMGLAAFGAAGSVDPWPLMSFADGEITTPFDLPPVAEYDETVARWHAHFSALGYRRSGLDPAHLDRDVQAIRLAHSAQCAVDDVLSGLVAHARRITGEENVCIAGGVGLNCSANGRLTGPIYVPPVPHDAGVGLGAAWAVSPPASALPPLSPYLGPTLGSADAWLTEAGLPASDADPATIAKLVLDGQIGAVVTGRSEVGPRALCHRSIIALPSSTEMRDRVNQTKGRELWRPLGPVSLASAEGHLWSSASSLHRYMLGAAQVFDPGLAQSPATVHVDGSARPQIISEDELVGRVLVELDRQDAPSVLINTSFNGRGMPIVDSFSDGYDCATSLRLDFLVLGDRLLRL